MLLSQNRAARSHLTNNRQTRILRFFRQPDAPAGARDHLNRALAGKCTQMLFGGIRRAEPKFGSDFRPGGWIAGFIHIPTDNVEYLTLPRSEFHGWFPR